MLLYGCRKLGEGTCEEKRTKKLVKTTFRSVKNPLWSHLKGLKTNPGRNETLGVMKRGEDSVLRFTYKEHGAGSR